MTTQDAWRSIRSAPKDGTRVLIQLKSGGVICAYWEANLIDKPTKGEPFKRVGGWATGVVISWGYQEDERFKENEAALWQPLPEARKV